MPRAWHTSAQRTSSCYTSIANYDHSASTKHTSLDQPLATCFAQLCHKFSTPATIKQSQHRSLRGARAIARYSSSATSSCRGSRRKNKLEPHAVDKAMLPSARSREHKHAHGNQGHIHDKRSYPQWPVQEPHGHNSNSCAPTKVDLKRTLHNSRLTSTTSTFQWRGLLRIEQLAQISRDHICPFDTRWWETCFESQCFPSAQRHQCHEKPQPIPCHNSTLATDQTMSQPHRTACCARPT